MHILSRRWLQRGTTVGILLLTAVMLTACIEATSSSTINTDLTGATTMRIGFSKAAIQLLGSVASSTGTGTPTPMMQAPSAMDLFGDLTTQVNALGGTTMPFDDGQFTGVDIALTFNSLDEMQNQINTILGESPMMGMMGAMGAAAATPGAGMGSGQGALAQITATQNGNTIRIDGMVDPLSSVKDMVMMGGMSGSAAGFDPSFLLAGGKVDLAFTMPGAITSADPLAMQNGNTASWHFNLGDPKATIFVEAAAS